jgi:hypothetical protein
MMRNVSKTLKMRKMKRERERKMMMTVEAVLEMALVTALVTAGRVGMGRGVGVVGAGTRHELLSDFITVPI